MTSRSVALSSRLAVRMFQVASSSRNRVVAAPANKVILGRMMRCHQERLDRGSLVMVGGIIKCRWPGLVECEFPDASF